MTPAVRSSRGWMMVVAGVAMLVLPGPGFLTIVGGLTLLERDVPAVARVTAWGRGRFRGWWPAPT